MKEPRFRCPTAKAINELSLELQLPGNMEDWEWIVGKPEDVEKYFAHYYTLTDDNKKFTLMDLIISKLQIRLMRILLSFGILKPLLKTNFAIHEYSIFYWCSFETEDINDCWKITPFVRQFWQELKS
jgi:hypothetical protein